MEIQILCRRFPSWQIRWNGATAGAFCVLALLRRTSSHASTPAPASMISCCRFGAMRGQPRYCAKAHGSTLFGGENATASFALLAYQGLLKSGAGGF